MHKMTSTFIAEPEEIHIYRSTYFTPRTSTSPDNGAFFEPKTVDETRHTNMTPT